MSQDSTSTSAADIVGTNHGELLIGTDAADIIFAKAGSDIVAGGGGDDTIYGGPGKDQLFGDDGNDLLIGGPGGDWLNGGYGDDTLVGGHGADVFVFDDFWGNDVVRDFNPKQDTIQLPQVYFASLSDVLKAAHDDGHGNLVISTPSHAGQIDTITLIGVDASSLKAGNFLFV